MTGHAKGPLKVDITQSIVVEPGVRDSETHRSLAILRMTVFRNWPYLYDGSIDYEAAYLDEFLADPEAVIVVARIDDMAIGMATASRLSGQSNALIDPLATSGIEVDRTFYFGESVLLPQFRGLGIGHKFFDYREAAARAAGAQTSAFCAVVREAGHPQMPPNYSDLAPFWRKRGYEPLAGVLTSMDWKDWDQAASSSHPMQFWSRQL